MRANVFLGNVYQHQRETVPQQLVFNVLGSWFCFIKISTFDVQRQVLWSFDFPLKLFMETYKLNTLPWESSVTLSRCLFQNNNSNNNEVDEIRNVLQSFVCCLRLCMGVGMITVFILVIASWCLWLISRVRINWWKFDFILQYFFLFIGS